jgi:Ca-activated chloride channel family protein
MTGHSEYYTILGISRGATLDEVRRAYRRAARRLHPDATKERGHTEEFLRVQKAFEILSDPEKRAEYDASLPEERVPAPPVSLQVNYSRSTLARLNEPQIIYTILELSPPPASGEDQNTPASVPLNLSLIIDCSTSMNGERMDTIKVAALELLRQLNQQDIISIVVFSDRAEVILPAQRSPNVRKAENQIRRMSAGGGTEIFQGLQAGFLEVKRNSNKNTINHLILLTDGRTYGDEDACLEVAGKAALSGISISAVGIGEEWNDDFLDTLAQRTGGSSFYLAETKQIKTFLENRIHRLNKVYAEQVSMELALHPGAELRGAFRLDPEPAPLPTKSPMRIGTLNNAAKLSVLMEFLLAPMTPGAERLDLLSGTLKLVIPSRSDPDCSLPFTLSLPISENVKPQTLSEEFMQAILQLSLYRLQERAHEELAAGDIRKASRSLHYLASQLLAQDQQDLARTVALEVENLQYNQSISEKGKKGLKYGTRALLLPASLKEEHQ